MAALFVDPRRKNGLTPLGRHFAFSLMHHRARAVHLDLEDAELLIFQFPVAEENKRSLKVHTASDLDRDLFSYEELEQRVRETYTIWREVLARRESELRSKADRDRGGFGLTG